MRALVLALTLLMAGPAAAENVTVRAAIDGFVRPAYAAFEAGTATLSARMTSLCAAPSPGGLDLARAAFRDTVRDWSRVETIRFGPVVEENRLERILFWPDRKGTGLKQVQAAIADEDPSAVDPATLAGKSVAMQGLGALEFVLFGTGAEALATPDDTYRCAYGQAIAANLLGIAGTVAAEWARPDGFARVWADPGADNPLFRDDAEALTRLFDVFAHGLELLRDVRIGGFLGETSAEDRPKLAVFRRSEMTLPSIEANIAGLKALFDAAGFAPLLPTDAAWLPGSIDFEFANAIHALEGLDGPLGDTLADPQKRDTLVYARLVTSSLSDLFGEKLAPALGLTAGFSSLDGD